MKCLIRFAAHLLAPAVFLAAGCGGGGDYFSPYNRGVTLQVDGRLPAAVRAYKAALEDRPENVHARFNLALCYDRLGMQAEAESQYREVIRRAEGGRSLSAARLVPRPIYSS